MPTYVYQCKSCGHRFEAWQHMTDEPLTTCPQCGAAIHRVIFANGVVFKGSGFYSTDARKASEASVPAASTPDTTKADATKTETTKSTDTATKTDTSPATPTAASTPTSSTPPPATGKAAS